MKLDPDYPLKLLKREVHCEIEKFKILISRKKNINIIFDFKISPPTYGDCIDTLFLIRMLSSLGKKVSIEFVKGEYRKDWEYLNKDKFAKELINIANSLLPKECIINVFDNNKFRIKKDKDLHNLFFNQLPFFKRNQIPEIYIKALDLAFKLNKNTANNDFLFTRKTLDNIKHEFINKEKYICLPLRYNPFTSQSRNIGVKALEIIDLIRNSTNSKIMIVSNLEGCNFYRKMISKAFNSNIYYCKDFSKSFIGDVEIILKSVFYLQYYGGGMLTIARNSDIPYLICNRYANHEYLLKKQKKFPWSNNLQKYILSDEYDVFMKALKSNISLINKLLD